MPNTPITGVPLPTPGGSDQVPADLMTAFSNAETMFVGRFASAADRDGKITAPVGGQVAWLTSPGKFVYYDAILAAWADLMNPTAWDTWTPQLRTVSNATFNLGVGGSQVGRYRLTGKMVELQAWWLFGSSQVGGAGGAITFDLPAGLPGTSIMPQGGSVSLYVPSVSRNFYGFWSINPPSVTLALPHFPYSQTDTGTGAVQDTSDGTAAGTGIPLIPGNYPFQNTGAMLAWGNYEIA